jgi:protein disulfide-isomerase A1
MLFAPWGTHLEALVPEWYKIAALFKNNDDIVIAKMDYTANEVKGLRVSGLPCVVLFTKDNKEGKGNVYYESRKAKDMVEWL